VNTAKNTFKAGNKSNGWYNKQYTILLTVVVFAWDFMEDNRLWLR